MGSDGVMIVSAVRWLLQGKYAHAAAYPRNPAHCVLIAALIHPDTTRYDRGLFIGGQYVMRFSN